MGRQRAFTPRKPRPALGYCENCGRVRSQVQSLTRQWVYIPGPDGQSNGQNVSMVLCEDCGEEETFTPEAKLR